MSGNFRSAAELPDNEPDPGFQDFWDKVFAIAKKRIKMVALRLSEQLVIHTARTIADEVSRITIKRRVP